MKLVESWVRWLASPGGSLLWDVLLQALGIFFTVVILQRYFEHQERKRWHPARQQLYKQLFEDANWILASPALSEYWEKRPDVWYKFGYVSYGRKQIDSSLPKKLQDLPYSALTQDVTALADEPELVESFKQQLDSTLGQSAAVFLARGPELNNLIGRLREEISTFEGSLEIYREARESGHNPAAILGDTAIRQAGIALKEFMFAAYFLSKWLADHADGVKPHPSEE